jgi:hypothetical protein
MVRGLLARLALASPDDEVLTEYVKNAGQNIIAERQPRGYLLVLSGAPMSSCGPSPGWIAKWVPAGRH